MPSKTSASDLGNEPPAPQDSPRDTDINITSWSAVAQWQKLGDQISILKDLSLDLHHEVRSDKAFFKISALVVLKAHPGRSKRVYLFVHPECIQSLTLEDNPETRYELGPGTIRLRFGLSSPMTLLGPKLNLTPQSKASGDILDALRVLAGQLSFAVYTNLSAKLLPGQLPSLCEAVSQHRLGSIADHANPAKLYGGKGGQVVNVEGLTEELAEVAPIGDGQAESDSPGPSRKRQRDASGRPRPLEVPEIPRELIEDILDNRLAALKRDMMEGLKRDMTKQLEGLKCGVVWLVDDHLDKLRKDTRKSTSAMVEKEVCELKEQLEEELLRDIEDKVEQVEARLYNYVDSLGLGMDPEP